MKRKISEKVEIPQGVSCTYENGILTCKKGSVEIKKEIKTSQAEIKIHGTHIAVECAKGNKNQYKIIMSILAHIRNIFEGLDEKFVYELEACNVHFPMSLKVEKDRITITNFLGEKNPRYAKVLPDVTVDIKGQKITVSSHYLEAAGQTAANLEKATKIRGRDRRIFQDGIFITTKPERKI